MRFPARAGSPLEVRMARSSPGRYAAHEFGKNVYLFEARGDGDATLTTELLAPAQWRIMPTGNVRARALPAVCRSRRRHLLGRRWHACAPERTGDLRLGAVAAGHADPRPLHAAAWPHVARLDAAVPDRRPARPSRRRISSTSWTRRSSSARTPCASSPWPGPAAARRRGSGSRCTTSAPTRNSTRTRPWWRRSCASRPPSSATSRRSTPAPIRS